MAHAFRCCVGKVCGSRIASVIRMIGRNFISSLWSQNRTVKSKKVRFIMFVLLRNLRKAVRKRDIRDLEIHIKTMDFVLSVQCSGCKSISV